MPAPDATFLAKLRAGQLARHWLFYLNHIDGAVRVWDGIGDLVHAGNTYTGIGALGGIENLSDSRELQNHDVIVSLSRLPFSQLGPLNMAVRGRAATLYQVWIDDDTGLIVAAKTAFDGLANRAMIEPGETEHTIKVHLRGFMASWSAVPGAYYTPDDQESRYAGDTGFSQVPGLENKTVTGWSVNVETSGDSVEYYANATGGSFNYALRGSGSKTPIGHHTLGLTAVPLGTQYSPSPALTRGVVIVSSDVVNGGTKFEEADTNALALMNYQTNRVQVGGVSVYVDAAGDVRSAGGKLILTDVGAAASTGTASRLRKHATIASNGAATANTVTLGTYVSSGVTVHVLHASNLTLPGFVADQSGAIYEDAFGAFAEENSGLATWLAAHEEETTASAVTISAGNTLQVGGVNCNVSTTGVVLSSGGRRIIRKAGSGGGSAYFLRIWK